MNWEGGRDCLKNLEEKRSCWRTLGETVRSCEFERKVSCLDCIRAQVYLCTKQWGILVCMCRQQQIQ